jgi:hypothetical protein
MPTILINPFDEANRIRLRPAARLSGLEGKTIALLDISKAKGNFFLDRLEQLLKERYGVARIVRAMKPTFTKPAPTEVIQSLIDGRVDGVIEALAD